MSPAFFAYLVSRSHLAWSSGKLVQPCKYGWVLSTQQSQFRKCYFTIFGKKNSSFSFFGTKSEDEQDVLNILGTAYTSALFLGYMNCATMQPTIAMGRVIFYREKFSGMYSSMAYVIAQVKRINYLSGLERKKNNIDPCWNRVCR